LRDENREIGGGDAKHPPAALTVSERDRGNPSSLDRGVDPAATCPQASGDLSDRQEIAVDISRVFARHA
jgi:hypothetical protein